MTTTATRQLENATLQDAPDGTLELAFVSQWIEEYRTIESNGDSLEGVVQAAPRILVEADQVEDALEWLFRAQGNNGEGAKLWSDLPSATKGDLVVVLERAGDVTAPTFHYCDSVGWRKIRGVQAVDWAHAGRGRSFPNEWLDR